MFVVLAAQFQFRRSAVGVQWFKLRIERLWSKDRFQESSQVDKADAVPLSLSIVGCFLFFRLAGLRADFAVHARCTQVFI